MLQSSPTRNSSAVPPRRPRDANVASLPLIVRYDCARETRGLSWDNCACVWFSPSRYGWSNYVASVKNHRFVHCLPTVLVMFRVTSLSTFYTRLFVLVHCLKLCSLCWCGQYRGCNGRGVHVFCSTRRTRALCTSISRLEKRFGKENPASES